MFRLPSAGNAQLILMFRDRLRRDLRLRTVFDGPASRKLRATALLVDCSQQKS
jgi:hypothetical protein